ncbi:helix-turn-helix domain-containing protein (plasmid) [Nocardia sp. CA-151230]|uniref:helix-turn-helix domain-containing protein n=1 Tax=Nocardia sp. CA-151230 TaxID=3239982 RepID=UPI003D8B3A73
MSGPGEVIHAMRQRRGLSRKQLAGLAGTTQRQIARYEASEQLPSLPAAERIAFVLGITLDVLAGRVPMDLDLEGQWFFAWQIGQEIEVLEASVTYRDGNVAVYGDGGHGELRLWDRNLGGWFRLTAGRIAAAAYLDLHDDWTYAVGGWTGAGAERPGPVMRGWSAMARTDSQAISLVRSMVSRNGELPG